MADQDDDWEKIETAVPADDGWEPVPAAERPAPDVGEALPEAFMARVRAGEAFSRVVQAAGKGAAEGMGPGTPTGFEDDTLNYLIEKGVFHDPATGRPGPLQMANEAILMPAAQLWQGITRAVSGAIHGTGGAMEQLVTEFGGSSGEAARAKREVINLGNWAMIEGGMGRFSRPSVESIGPMDRPVGGLPTPQDFAAATKLLTEPPKEGMIRFYHGASEFANPAEYEAWLTPQEAYARNYRGGPNKVHYVDLTQG
ncbi:hypothetical protein LRP30_21710 [Bradyrhizobium sp. C-145]|uniref:hypothetical protein n=1 Tax=Bradyrhizobium sp. C-145 TaxID=574727 RepID=UPI00201B8B4D|nr:hypothetical protein [Bradyrhizobium sp. C-145]UQR67707.1 hypothetical protein LRP30_21710 [Bradyrhizobium sp. C-145]